MHQVNIAVAVAGLAVVLAGLISAREQSLPLSRPLLALGIGVAAGPAALHWIAPADWAHGDVILKEAARFALAISVFGIALRTPKADYRALLRPLAILLTLGMAVMWIVSAGLAWALLGLSPLAGLLLAAAVTPTDPVVASSIVTGGLAERSLPDRLRGTLSLESGANDGLAYLIVMLPLLLMGSAGPADGVGRWVVEILLVGVLLAVALGAGIGHLSALALRHADRKGWVEEHSLIGLSVALSLTVVAVAKLAGSDGILAAFAAGVGFAFGVDRGEEYKEQNVQEAIAKLFNLPIFVLFGAMLPWRAWVDLGWPALAFALAVLLLRRPLALVAAGRGLGPAFARRDLAFLGWFGPVGVAAMYYALLAAERSHDPVHWHVASLVILCSVTAHGITSGPGLAAYRRNAE